MKKLIALLLLVLFIPVCYCQGQVLDTYKTEFKEFKKSVANTKLTYPEYFAISEYKNNDYSSYNAYLRTGEIYGKHTPARVKLMKSGLKNLPAHKGKTYRGTSFEDYPDLFTYYTKVGSIIRDRGFMSSSVDRKVAQSFLTDNGEEYLLLMVIEGQSGRNLAGIGSMGIDKAESEILFPAGTKFKILKTRKIKVNMPDYGLENSLVTEVTLKEVMKKVAKCKRKR